MAIDFMVMPLSRYVTGDFITPVMRYAWDQGLPYSIIGPDGERELPKDVPFGGPGATAQRQAVIDMLLGDLAALPAPVPSHLWNERSPDEPRFHRVDPASFGVLLEEAQQSRSLFGLVKKQRVTHLTATVFLPVDFPAPFEMTSPMSCATGSVPRALAELGERRWPAAAEAARAMLHEALTDATTLRLPLIVDF